MPPFPDDLGYLWSWFTMILNSSGGDFSPMQLKAFFEMQDIEPERWEIDGLLTLNETRVQENGKSKT